MDLLILHPWLALIPAVLLAALWAWSRSWAPLAGAVLWLLYVVWEVWGVPETEGDANIRIDLLLIYPLLLAATLVAVVLSLTDRRRANR